MDFVTMALALIVKINLLNFVFISTEIVTSLVSPFLQACVQILKEEYACPMSYAPDFEICKIAMCKTLFVTLKFFTICQLCHVHVRKDIMLSLFICTASGTKLGARAWGPGNEVSLINKDELQ